MAKFKITKREVTPKRGNPGYTVYTLKLPEIIAEKFLSVPLVATYAGNAITIRLALPSVALRPGETLLTDPGAVLLLEKRTSGQLIVNLVYAADKRQAYIVIRDGVITYRSANKRLAKRWFDEEV